jgi:Mn-dependent DtxR family transcriptional regulator
MKSMTREEALKEFMRNTTYTREKAEELVETFAHLMDYELVD